MECGNSSIRQSTNIWVPTTGKALYLKGSLATDICLLSNEQSGRRYSLGSLLRKIPQRNKRVKGFKINSTATIAVKLTDLHLFLAELVDNIFQQGLENQFCVLDILREVTFSLVTWGSQESSSSFQSTPCLLNCISWNIKKKKSQCRKSSNPDKLTCRIKFMVLFIAKVVLVKSYVCTVGGGADKGECR